jgi:excisionase family DNA binding protein
VLTVTVEEVAKRLNVTDLNYITRLIRGGALVATKRGKRWDVDEGSVAAYVQRVASKRSSRSNFAAERAQRMAEAEALFT